MKIKLYQCGGELNNRYSEYPLGLGYLKSNCINADIEIVKDRKELRDCDLIGLSSVVYGLKEAVNILNSTKIPVIIGGQGTLWDGLKNYPFKHIVIGEGERALQKIIDNKAKTKIMREPLIENLDTIKHPFRGKCPTKLMSFMTSRGCPFNCYFCSSQAYWKKVRFHSAKYIMEEIKIVSKTNPQAKIVYFQDDLFIFNTKRFNKFYELWMKEGFNKKYWLETQIRAKVLTEDKAIKLKEMRCRRVKFGAETGSDRILKLYNKRATVKDNQKTINIAKRAGLSISASFIHDFPLETKEDVKATEDFIKKNKRKLTMGGWYKFQAFPGTKFYDGKSPLEYNMKVR